jgi:hypothetical protein
MIGHDPGRNMNLTATGTGFRRQIHREDCSAAAVTEDGIAGPCACFPVVESLGTARRRTNMATARLRLYPHPEDESEDVNTPAIPIRLSDLYPLLAQAYRDNYVWLRDFEDDELMVSRDLYEVVRAFSNCRPSA